MIKSGGMEGANGAGVILNSYNGCSYNPNPHDADAIFCCDKDHQCWGSLQECMPNCPCKANCSKKKGH
ncbi:hypothetical protein PR202_ga30722 [Eleusine coracana subsp. coracana]|uniref:Uncharacterized protein n=1 Tax=Eleusine coracana subsp. coracana TaxID=191504 RepID=A0AAV5DP37_ELECO|nr:hypothetical protein PR202_ga30722 [Eleusine coracana subsp. coracana]